MSHSQNLGPSNSTIERMLRDLKIGQSLILSALNISVQLERRQMAEFTALNARVSKLTSVAESIKTMYDGLKAERDALKAELEALKAADQLDQAAVDEAEASLATVTATLEALSAVASGTPVAGSVS